MKGETTTIRRRLRRAAAVFALVASVCAVSVGCGRAPDGGGGAGTAGAGGEPAFSGPYAAEFRKAYEEAPTDLSRNILKDGRITEAEIQEVYDDYNTCLEPYGLQATWSAEQGETMGRYRGSMSDDEELKVMDECHARTGAGDVSSLYAAMSVNPDNVDQAAMDRSSYQCYVRHGLLPRPIGEDEYMSTMSTAGLSDNSRFEENLRRWHEFFSPYMSETFDGRPNPDYKYDGNSSQGRQFWSCVQDPLHQ